MRWARIETADGPRYGIVEGDSIAMVEGSPFGDHAPTGDRIALETAAFLPPVVPPTFYAAGLNYPEHAVAAANKRGEIPSLPETAISATALSTRSPATNAPSSFRRTPPRACNTRPSWWP